MDGCSDGKGGEEEEQGRQEGEEVVGDGVHIFWVDMGTVKKKVCKGSERLRIVNVVFSSTLEVEESSFLVARLPPKKKTKKTKKQVGRPSYFICL